MTNIQDTFDIVKCYNLIFYVRFDGLIKQASVPLCFQPRWVVPSMKINRMLRHCEVIKSELPIDMLKHYDNSITLARMEAA